VFSFRTANAIEAHATNRTGAFRLFHSIQNIEPTNRIEISED